MALWTSMNSWLFWGWNDWHVLTPSGTWFLRSLVRFFLLRFSLFASDEMQLSDCSTWHLVCWLLPFYRNLYRDLDVYQDRDIGACFVCIFFVIGPAPLSDLSVSYSSSERARISVHIFCLFCRASLSVEHCCFRCLSHLHCVCVCVVRVTPKQGLRCLVSVKAKRSKCNASVVSVLSCLKNCCSIGVSRRKKRNVWNQKEKFNEIDAYGPYDAYTYSTTIHVIR